VLLGALPAGAAVITPSGTSYAINATPGVDKTEPHVDGNLVAYSYSDGTNFTIHYYDLSTGQDTTIPTRSGELDFLSNIDAGRIVFTGVTAADSHISLYDTTAAPPTLGVVNPTPSSVRQAPDIGGNNVVWQSFTTGTASDTVVYNLISQTATQLTTDGLLDETPAISPDGRVVTWASCQRPISSAPCAIDDAVFSGGSWTTNVLTTDGNCSSPDTNGIIVAYACARTVNGISSDRVYFQPVGGGTEQAIDWGGQAGAISIASNFIAFAGLAPGAPSHQMYVAELTGGTTPTWDGNLYQIPTNGAGDVQLNDIAMEADGSLTVVWQQLDAQADVYGFNFTPESPQQQISGLAGTIIGYGLPHGLTTSLLAKLNAAQADFQAGSTALVCGDLQALINEANAQSDKGLTSGLTGQATQIINAATAIRQSLGC
jgi:hypothetical protein